MNRCVKFVSKWFKLQCTVFINLVSLNTVSLFSWIWKDNKQIVLMLSLLEHCNKI